MNKKTKITQPWEDIPANDDTRAGFHAGSGGYQGTAIKAKFGRLRDWSNLRPPKDKTSGFKKNITYA